MAKSSSNVTGWVGWVYFAGFMMLLSGFFQAIAGVVALFKDDVYVVGSKALWILNYTTWGWVHLLIGIFMVIAGAGIISGRTWARVVGVIFAVFGAVANFSFIPIYPWWSILMLVVDIVVIYALVVHGREAAVE